MFSTIRRFTSYLAAAIALARSRVVEVPTYHPQPQMVYTDFPLFKPFYVHMTTGPGHKSGRTPRGFTALISPSLTDPRTLAVQVSFCSNKDQFSKKQGRSYAAKAEQVTYNKRELPRILGGFASQCGVHNKDYAYILKYVV